MKFLLTVTPRRVQMPPVSVIEQSAAWIKSKLQDKTIDCCYSFVVGGGIGIFNADSAEAVQKLILSYPAFPFVDSRVDPLCDIFAGLEAVKGMVQQTQGT